MSFHVPEEFRITHPTLGDGSGNNGAFRVRFPELVPPYGTLTVFCIASDGAGWEHVSVSYAREPRSIPPSWEIMCRVKDLFWDEEDVVVQYHPRKSEYRNLHPGVLHLWRSQTIEFPTPNPDFVAFKR